MRFSGFLCALIAPTLLFQLELLGQDMPGMQHGDMSQMPMQHDHMNSAVNFLMGESSGTDFQPSAWRMRMLMTQVGDWHLMWMGQAFLVDTQQAGPRGGGKFYSTNWGMLAAVPRL